MWILKACPAAYLVCIHTSCFIFASSDKFSCPEAVFEVISNEAGYPLEEDVISNYIVTSCIECGHKCLECADCVTFSHLAERSHDINCKVNGHTSELMVKGGHGDDETWTSYKTIEPEICLTHRPCQNAGRCVKNSCEPEGYSCICPQWYYGKYCQNENSNFDVVFTSQSPVLSYIETDNIKSELSQFTFTAWFKISIGFQWYQLLSFMVNNMPGNINLRFETGSTKSYAIGYFVGEIEAKRVRTNIIPVNDDVWHHLGFAWSNTKGRWEVLVDGTSRAIRSKIKTGVIIPAGGRLVIGQEYTGTGFVADRGFHGQLSGVNFWDRALAGEELEALAKTSDSGMQGNILRWFQVLKNIYGPVEKVTPSKVINTNKELNFELQFGSSNTGQPGYILSPGPEQPMRQLSVCLWIKISVASRFVLYDVENEDGPAVSFGIDSNYYLFTYMNGSLVNRSIEKFGEEKFDDEGDLLSKLEQCRRKCEVDQTSKGLPTEMEPKQQRSNLERIKVPQFSGNIKNYRTWKKIFEDTMKRNYESEGSQLARMIEAIQATLRYEIKCFTATKAIREFLDKLFGDNKELIKILMNDIKTMKPLKVKDAKSIQNLVATVRGFILRMKDVGASDEAKSRYVFADILAKFTVEDQRAYARSMIDTKKIESLHTLLEYLEEEAKIMEYSQSDQRSSKIGIYPVNVDGGYNNAPGCGLGCSQQHGLDPKQVDNDNLNPDAQPFKLDQDGATLLQAQESPQDGVISTGNAGTANVPTQKVKVHSANGNSIEGLAMVDSGSNKISFGKSLRTTSVWSEKQKDEDVCCKRWN
ncbi:sushi, von Willebrand factor type A, EGF and pentraxin domain-containing 1 [Paramuricea clavata]|uniref:Sushi, von Willebrand factor type A, EGF and pentraxin domain-containing 1 n=1 Tax=Paramuricea clavata TaxID=317549 RepID=A0A7D9DPY6_PARCT|nr:sushi, von Willebrand factor type A, EGF and pentraxin domain-containing 1 [Paramuricea clavata]